MSSTFPAFLDQNGKHFAHLACFIVLMMYYEDIRYENNLTWGYICISLYTSI